MYSDFCTFETMDLQSAKLDLIDWLISINDEQMIQKLTSIKNNDTDQIDHLFKQDGQVSQILDKRLEEEATDFVDAQTSLREIRKSYGL